MGLMLHAHPNAQVERLMLYAHCEAWRPCLKKLAARSNAERIKYIILMHLFKWKSLPVLLLLLTAMTIVTKISFSSYFKTKLRLTTFLLVLPTTTTCLPKSTASFLFSTVPTTVPGQHPRLPSSALSIFGALFLVGRPSLWISLQELQSQPPQHPLLSRPSLLLPWSR